MSRLTADALSRLLSPRSVAVIGASSRPGRPGNQVIQTMRLLDPEIEIYPVTPRYDSVLDIPAFPDIASAPSCNLAIIASASDRIEADIDAALAHGVGGLLVFAAPVPDANRPAWLARVADRAHSAGVPLLGPDSLGFINYADRRGLTWAVPDQIEAGGISVISQSGTVFWEAITNDPRLRFSFSAHSGLEATVSIADLIRYSLSLPSTRVIGLYVETIRDATGFEAALRAAADAGVPVVALYAGRTDRARAQMMTHAGRLAGDHSSLEALFRTYGVARVASPDEWWTTLALLGVDRRLHSGGMAAIMDSGGGLAMFLDYANERGVEVARLQPETQSRIAGLLGHDAGDSAALDFWIGDDDRHARTQDVLLALADDPGVSGVVAYTTFAEATTAGFAGNIARACLSAVAATSKPIIAATYTSRQLYPDLMMEIASAGVPVLDGMPMSVAALRHALDHRDFTKRWKAAESRDGVLDTEKVSYWRAILRSVPELSEADALTFLSDFGIPCVTTVRADSSAGAVEAARTVGFPVVLKTDEGIAHKAAVGGVRLGLADEDAVRQAYAAMAAALGPRVVVAPMVTGSEVAVGVVGGQFGPVVMVGAGGVLIEVLSDRAFLLAPAAPSQVAAAMDELRVMDAVRHRLGDDQTALEQFFDIARAVSEVASAFAEEIAELDINPILISSSGCVAVDALIGCRLATKGDQ